MGQCGGDIKVLLGKNNKWTKEAEPQLMGREVQHSNSDWRMNSRAGNDKPIPGSRKQWAERYPFSSS